MSILLKKKLIPKEHQPWHLSYQRSIEARPSWSKHGMPTLSSNFIKLVKKNKLNGIHLDIGCGNGVKTVNFALEGLDTIGIDISEDGFKEAKELIKELRLAKKCRVLKASCLKMPFEDQTAKSASDILCFTHIKPKDQKKYKKELLRVLKSQGYVLIVLFSDKDEHFHGHKVSPKYTFKYSPKNPLMDGYAHYHGMFNYHFSEDLIKKTFAPEFEIIEMIEGIHPIYPHRQLWNVIIKKP